MAHLLRLFLLAILSGHTVYIGATSQEPAPGLPEFPSGATILRLAATANPAPPADEPPGARIIYGELLSHNAEEIRHTSDAQIVFRKNGFATGEATLAWPLPDILPGDYDLWTRFTQGGHNTQSFTISLGDPTSARSETRLSFSQHARSWESLWRKASGPLEIRAEDKRLVLRFTGRATQQRQLGDLLLVRRSSIRQLPPAPTPTFDPLNADNTPLAWLTLGTWAGPAGLSLWGLDYESTILPGPGDPMVVSFFDRGKATSWSTTQANQRGEIIIDQLDRDYVWAKATAYAHLYLHAAQSGPATLHVQHPGIQSALWHNGQPIESRNEPAINQTQSPSPLLTLTDVTDQGGAMSIDIKIAGQNIFWNLQLQAGWNRLLLKLVTQQRKGENLSFRAQLSVPQSSENETTKNVIHTSLVAPQSAQIVAAHATRLIPALHLNAPFNLTHPGDLLTLVADFQQRPWLGETLPLPRMQGQLEVVVTDYDGREILRKQTSAHVPGQVTIDLGAAPTPGHYALHTRLLDNEGQLVTTYPPDGFNVIRGTAARTARHKATKIATCYYFMAERDDYRTLYFPWMQRMGILMNVGGNNVRALPFYEEARRENLTVIADMWNHRDPAYINAYVQEVASLVDYYKSYNEIDLHPDRRGTPRAWVAKAQQEYEIIKKHNPKAVMLGASFARPGAGDWFVDCLRLGLADQHDVWDLHCYPQFPPKLEASMGNSHVEEEAGLNNAYARLGLKNTKPIWIGETAARASHGFDGRRWQADTTAKMIANALSRPNVPKIAFLVPWQYTRDQPKYYIHDIEGGHMPVQAAYYTAAALIDGFDYRRIPFDDSNIQAARFGRTFMAWTTDGLPRTIQLETTAGTDYVRVDVVGRIRNLDRSSQSAQTLLLEIGSSPIYVLPRAEYERLTAF